MSELKAEPTVIQSPQAFISESRVGRWLAPLLLCLFFLAGAVPLILMGSDRGRGASDQDQFHLPTIRLFAAQWPRFDLHDYRSSTTPGYHLLLAAFSHWVSSDLGAIRLAGTVFTLGLLATLAGYLSVRQGSLLGVAMALPLACSIYVFSSGVWLLPDNIAWWGLLIILLICLSPGKGHAKLVAEALVLVLVVLTRQTLIWAALLLWTAAWLGADHLHGFVERVRRVSPIILWTVPAFVLLICFVALWHGLVPPTFRGGTLHSAQGTRTQGISLSAPAFLLAVTGAYGVFFLGGAASRVASLYKAGRRVMAQIVTGMVAGVVIGLLAPTSYDFSAGRSSGFWNAVSRFPVMHHRSILIAGLAGMGGGVLAVFRLVLDRRDRILFMVAFIAFAVAQTLNANVYQRYFEPFVLMVLPLMAARIATSKPLAGEPRYDIDHRVRMAVAPSLLAALLAAITFWSLRPPRP